jgi:aspartyl-tRNA(Asn)/glutamyl-tRNA(Gln) amidotransferase subunit C
MKESEFEKLMRLCRLDCTPEQLRGLQADVEKVLAYVALLDEVKTEGVAPRLHIIENLSSVMRDDTAGTCLPRQLLLDNAPSHVGGMVRVPIVIKAE